MDADRTTGALSRELTLVVAEAWVVQEASVPLLGLGPEAGRAGTREDEQGAGGGQGGFCPLGPAWLPTFAARDLDFWAIGIKGGRA